MTRLVLIALCLLTCSHAQQLPASWQVPRMSPPYALVVHDESQTQLCGATAVGPTLILTAAHCVKGDAMLYARRAEPMRKARVKFVDLFADVALLEASERFASWAFIRCDLPAQDDSVHYTHHGGLHFWTFSQGTVRSVQKQLFETQWRIEADIAIREGSSGAGLFNASDELVGVTSERYTFHERGVFVSVRGISELCGAVTRE